MTAKINPGIRRVVALLNENGYRTVDSGDGKTHDFECDREVGYVVVALSPDQRLEDSADDIYRILRIAGVPKEAFFGDSGIHIQANYCPSDSMRLIDISKIYDELLGKE